jgi:hypothetical protein
VNAADIQDKVDTIKDHLGEITTHLPTASFQVDLIEPNRPELVSGAVPDTKRIIAQQLFRDTFPWCLITVFDLEA